MVLGIHVAGVRYGVHVIFVILLCVVAFTGYFVQVLLVILSLTAHELAHLVTASLAGTDVEELLFTPFGGVLRVQGVLETDPGAEVAIALAGPFQSALLASLTHLLAPPVFWDQELVSFFQETNAALAFFNLLPALPLDGGRALRGILAHRFGYGAVTRWMVGCGKVCGLGVSLGGLLALGMGRVWWTALAAGPFLYWAAGRETAAMPYRSMAQLLRKRTAVRQHGAMAARTLVALADRRLADIMPHLAARRYHLILVVDEELRPLATLSEAQLVKAFSSGGARQRLWEMLEK